MKAREILCLAILRREVEAARAKCKSVFELPGQIPFIERVQKYENDICRECLLIVLHRFFRTHGIPHYTVPHAAGKLICIDNCRIRPVFFLLDSAQISAAMLLQMPVFLPKDFEASSMDCERLLFVFMAAPIKLVLRTDLYRLMRESFSEDEVASVYHQQKLFIVAAPDIAECRKIFRPLPQNSSCLGNRSDLHQNSRAAFVNELTPFPQVFDWHGV